MCSTVKDICLEALSLAAEKYPNLPQMIEVAEDTALAEMPKGCVVPDSVLQLISQRVTELHATIKREAIFCNTP